MTTLSRYPCPYCSTPFENHDRLKAHVVSKHGVEPLPKPHGLVTITINGQRYERRVEASTTLYNLIHDELGLTGAKMFCDRGACGSCTVIMEGRPILSCMTLAIECDGKSVETVEGIAQANHPLIETYVKHHTMQCGYCTPGFVVTAKALLDRNPDPTDDEIRQALAGNLCRCGTYPQHPKAIAETAEILRKSVSPPSSAGAPTEAGRSLDGGAANERA
jgi:aerobic-type carbon monoxide dehydrogenase small subunit (CoxS/CutS family)